MRRSFLLVLLSGMLALAATGRLYLKDGTHHMVREYQVLSDRVRYYSIERGDWEEIPTELVDLVKTKAEEKRAVDSVQEESKALEAEEKAERALRREAEKVPVEAGVYAVQGEAIKPMKVAESKVVNHKGRNMLKAVSPIPIVTGRQSIELDGLHAASVVTDDRPEFYIRLSNEERFGIMRLKPLKASRQVEMVDIIPVTKETVETRDEVEVFRKQEAEMLYKIWPTKALEPGEYAVVEYTEGKMNIQVWDFAFRAK